MHVTSHPVATPMYGDSQRRLNTTTWYIIPMYFCIRIYAVFYMWNLGASFLPSVLNGLCLHFGNTTLRLKLLLELSPPSIPDTLHLGWRRPDNPPDSLYPAVKKLHIICNGVGCSTRVDCCGWVCSIPTRSWAYQLNCICMRVLCLQVAPIPWGHPSSCPFHARGTFWLSRDKMPICTLQYFTHGSRSEAWIL